MKPVRTFLLVGLGLSLSACAAVDAPTRNTPYEQLPETAVAAPEGYQLTQQDRPPYKPAVIGSAVVPHDGAAVTRASTGDAIGSPPASLTSVPVSVNTVTVRVPRYLTVSEANRYLPRADIVWREDPVGDRHVQVQKIMQDAFVSGASALNGPIKVDVDVQLVRFHALTEKARYTTGGVHSITFDMAIKDPETGELVVPIRRVRADLKGYGGQQAIAAESRGITQKVRISDHLANVIQQELTNPEGYVNANLGFIQVLNNI